MLTIMDNTGLELNTENLTILEEQLATLFVGNTHVRETRFQQALVNLLQTNPIILEASLKIKPEQGESFILLLIQQVFNYSINYRHAIYKPYCPRTNKEKVLLKKVIQLHFPLLLENGDDLFAILELSYEQSEEEGSKQSRSNYVKPESENDYCPIPDHRDPGLREDFLQELWVVSKNQEHDQPEELVGSYPSWVRGVIRDMRRTSSLFKKFKDNENRTFISREDIKYQPHHRIINLLIAMEFYWIMNQREVNLAQKMTNAEMQVAIQDYLHTIADQFLKLLPENHLYRLKVSAEERRSWECERLRGMMGAKQLLAQFSDNKLNQIIECTEYTINLREERVQEFTPSGMRSKRLVIKEYTHDEVDNINYKDPGLDEEFLWDLYGAKLKEKVKWNFEPAEDWPPWTMGILSGMTSSNAVYREFLKSKERSKIFQSRRFQPHHANIRLLIAAEYFWLFNHREVVLPEELSFFQAKAIQRKHIYDIYEGFLELYRPDHPERIRCSRLERELEWSVEKIRGSSGASKIVFTFSLHGKSWLVEATTSSIVTKEMKKSDGEK